LASINGGERPRWPAGSRKRYKSVLKAE